MWLVSGTFSTSLRQLVNQVKLLGCDSEYLDATTYYSSNEAVVAWFKGRMICHTKNQRIGGEVALALPDADCQTKWLTMSDDERLLYGVHECSGGHTLALNDTARFRAAAHLYAKDIVCGEKKWENDMARGLDGDSKQGDTQPTMRTRRRTASSFRRRRRMGASTPPWSTSSARSMCRTRRALGAAGH